MKLNYRFGVVLAFFIMISTPVFANFTENFEDYDDKYIDTSLLPLNSEDIQWNDWYAAEGIAETANEQGTTAILANDPDNPNNKVLKLTRTKTGSSTVNLDLKRDIQISDNERIEISFRMRKNGDQFGIKISDALELLRQDQFKFTNASSSIMIQQSVFKKNEWQVIKYTYNTDTMIACLYIDDNFMGSQKLSKKPDFKNVQLRINRDYRAGTIYFDDITAKSMKLPESIAFEDIANGQQWDSVLNNLDLKQSYDGVTYEWSSDNEAVITSSGIVTQDLFCQKQVKLTAKMFENNVWMKDVVFDVIVPSKGDAVLKESFNTQTTGIDISTSTTDGYGEWKLNADTYSVATSQGSSMKLIQDGKNGNKVLEIIAKGAELLQPVVILENVINSGVVTANVRFKNLTPSFCISLAPFKCPYSSEEDIEIYIQYAVRHVMAKYNMYEILDIAEEFRCHEDFAKCNSNKKTDFHRKWYHTRSTYSTISLEAEMKKYSENSDGQELPLWDMNSTTEEEIISEVMVKQFMDSLSEKDRKILQMRLEGYTLKKIAQKLGYTNHSGVQKRITKIGLAYQEFTKDDLGFDEEN